ncbi:MAG: hypothetical protein U5Q16_09580 [Gammaproteobacteria bacterium]|nr:hypothetical protein [Gammaproteobacteria bacterium]
MLGALTAWVLLGVNAAVAAEECTPSKWGPEDEIGSANLVTPERVRAAAALVRQGRSQPLGIVIDSSTPAFAPRGLSLQVVQPNQQGGQRLTEFGYDAVYNDDVAHLWFGIGSQIDGLGHLAEDGVYLLETMNTGALVREGVNEFMFVLGQARVRGTVQMIVNPVAMW